jgi:1-phosphofructokinase family hexose kinase
LILTVTPNTALDQVYEIEHYIPGARIRVDRQAECIGGKGNLASAFAADVGAKSVSLGFAAGQNGKRLAELLRARGARPDFSMAKGETRRLIVVVDKRREVQTWLVAEALEVNRRIERDLEKRVARWLPEASWLALCGSLPASCSTQLYYRLCRRAHRAGVPVLIDARGKPLAQALAAQPEIVRLNKEELELTLGTQFADLPTLTLALRRLLAEGIQLAVCSLGAEGAIAVTPAHSWRFVPPQIRQKSSAGSGDAFTAAIMVWREKGAEWPEAIRWACAAGAAKATEARTDHPLDMKRVRTLYRRVHVMTL